MMIDSKPERSLSIDTEEVTPAERRNQLFRHNFAKIVRDYALDHLFYLAVAGTAFFGLMHSVADGPKLEVPPAPSVMTTNRGPVIAPTRP